MAISIDQISFETKQKKKIRLISILFLVQLKKNYFGNILNFLKNLSKHYSTRALMYSRKNDKVHNSFIKTINLHT